MKFSGTTASIIIHRENKLYIAHLGDTRAIIGRKQKNQNKKVYQLTTDHAPTLKEEKIRIYNYGGEVKRLSTDFSDKVNYKIINFYQILKLTKFNL